VFTAFVGYGGSGQTASLIILDFKQGQANIAYQWVGQDAISFRSTTGKTGDGLLATAPYWTLGDPHCCPVRTYHFTVGVKGNYLTSLSDDRPWLGIYALPTISGLNNARSPLRVTGIAPHSPAAASFHVGDIITAVTGVPSKSPGLGPAIVDEIEALKAGGRVSFRVNRFGRTLTVHVHLGSIIDPSAQNAEAPSKFEILEI
jgi:hypothetical protein